MNTFGTHLVRVKQPFVSSKNFVEPFSYHMACGIVEQLRLVDRFEEFGIESQLLLQDGLAHYQVSSDHLHTDFEINCLECYTMKVRCSLLLLECYMKRVLRFGIALCQATIERCVEGD
jgi:hypothetical protein